MSHKYKLYTIEKYKDNKWINIRTGSVNSHYINPDTFLSEEVKVQEYEWWINHWKKFSPKMFDSPLRIRITEYESITNTLGEEFIDVEK